MFGERLKRARAAKGLSMKDLAALVGVSANMIKKYEHGHSMPSSGILLKLSEALHVPSRYFFKEDAIQLSELKFRKRIRLSQKAVERIKAEVLRQAEGWFSLRDLWPNFPIPVFKGIEGLPQEITDLSQVEMAAAAVRESWRLGDAPISDLIDVCESHGILVIQLDPEGLEPFDGLQATVDDQPVLVVKRDTDGARQRFTLAHELGHLLLGNALQDELDEEKACDRFAGALLLPKNRIIGLLGAERRRIEVVELHVLKHQYGMSMQAVLRRAADLHIISQSAYKMMCIEFNKRGWRTREPGAPISQELSDHFRLLVFRALAERIIGESKAAELLSMSLAVFHEERQLRTAYVSVQKVPSR